MYKEKEQSEIVINIELKFLPPYEYFVCFFNLLS